MIEAQGGKFQTSAEVQSIAVVNQTAKGVILADGTRILANNVLASVAPGQLYGHLLKGHLPDDEKAAVDYRQGRGNFSYTTRLMASRNGQSMVWKMLLWYT